MKFSIVTTCLNAAETISDAVQRAWLQRDDVPAFEHIIADGASQDHTLTELAKFAQL